MATALVGRVEDLKPGSAVKVDLDGTPVAVFNVDGEFYAIGDICSHEHSSLSEGYLDEEIVECPKHGATFDVRTGRNLSLPATRPVPTFAVRIEDGDLYVETK